MKSYKCNKCGKVVQIVWNDDLSDISTILPCQEPFAQRTSGLCLGRLIPVNIKPAPCKDCDE